MDCQVLMIVVCLALDLSVKTQAGEQVYQHLSSISEQIIRSVHDGYTCRYAGVDGVADPAWESYHAAAPLPAHVTQALLQPGATAASTTLPALRAFGSVAGELPHVATCLPGYTAPAGKVKPIEDAPADGSNAWAAAEAVIALSLKFSRPIMPPWTPPPKPARSLTELIPPRDLTPKPPPVTATDAFRNQVQGVVKSLALEYTQSIGGSVGTAAGPEGSVEAQAARQKALVFELNRSGKYLELKDSLKAAVVSGMGIRGLPP